MICFSIVASLLHLDKQITILECVKQNSTYLSDYLTSSSTYNLEGTINEIWGFEANLFLPIGLTKSRNKSILPKSI